MRTIDGGVHWRDVTPRALSGQRAAVGEFTVLTKHAAWVQSSADIAATTATIFRTVDDGLTWKSASAPLLGSIQFIDLRHGWGLFGIGAAGSEETSIYRSDDGGDTWMTIARAGPGGERSGLPFAGNKNGIAFMNPTTGWVTGSVVAPDWLYFYATRDGGYTWRQEHLALPSGLTSPWHAATAPPKFFTARYGVLPVFYSSSSKSDSVATIYLSHDRGATWMPTTPLSVTRWDPPMSFADVSHGWLVDRGILYITGDGGRKWTTARPGLLFNDVAQLEFVSPVLGWAVRSTPPFLLKTQDGGRTWVPIVYTISFR